MVGSASPRHTQSRKSRPELAQTKFSASTLIDLRRDRTIEPPYDPPNSPKSQPLYPQNPKNRLFLANTKVVVDQREACLQVAGDLIVPISRRDFDESRIYAELGEILMGDLEGRTNDSEITFFKSVGNAIQDLVVASFLEERAQQENLGTEVAL